MNQKFRLKKKDLPKTEGLAKNQTDEKEKSFASRSFCGIPARCREREVLSFFQNGRRLLFFPEIPQVKFYNFFRNFFSREKRPANLQSAGRGSVFARHTPSPLLAQWSPPSNLEGELFNIFGKEKSSSSETEEGDRSRRKKKRERCRRGFASRGFCVFKKILCDLPPGKISVKIHIRLRFFAKKIRERPAKFRPKFAEHSRDIEILKSLVFPYK